MESKGFVGYTKLALGKKILHAISLGQFLDNRTLNLLSIGYINSLQPPTQNNESKLFKQSNLQNGFVFQQRLYVRAIHRNQQNISCPPCSNFITVSAFFQPQYKGLDQRSLQYLQWQGVGRNSSRAHDGALGR